MEVTLDACGQGHLPTDFGSLLNEDHLVSTLGQHTRGLHPGRPCTDDQASRRSLAEVASGTAAKVLASGQRIHRAIGHPIRLKLVDTVMAGNARDDLLVSSFLALGDVVRIGMEGTTH